MRRALWLVVPVLLATLSAGGQVIRGTPASVTSIGGNRTFVGGVPASVTSISPTLPFGMAPSFSPRTFGPCAGAGPLIPSALGCGNPIFPQNIQQFRNDSGHNFRRRGGFGRSGGVIVPYAYPYAVYTNYDPYALQRADQPVQIEIRIVNDGDDRQREYAPGDEILVRRQDREDEAHLKLRQEHEQPPQPLPNPAPTAQRNDEPSREVIPTVLIFRDGHRREVRNYAIMGKVLYDLENVGSRKVELAELDLPATVKENDERGVAFALPKEMQQ